MTEKYASRIGVSGKVQCAGGSGGGDRQGLLQGKAFTARQGSADPKATVQRIIVILDGL